MTSRIAVAALVVSLAAVPAGAACLPPDDARTLIGIALPDAIDGLAARCTPVLPAGAFLSGQGAALAGRYRREAPVDPARARHAIEAASGQDLGFLTSDDTVTQLAGRFVQKAIRDRVATRDCPTIDGLIALAAPLRADTMAEAILLALQLAGPNAIPSAIKICRDEGESGR